MKQRILAVLVLCVVLFAGQALTVSASSSDVWSGSPSDEWDDLGDPWVNSSEYGFANDIVVFATVFDGLEESIESVGDMDKLKVFSTELESGHAYLVSLDFICTIDQENLDKYDDVNLQVRFPTTLLKNSPNAIGYSINGEQLETWYDTFGINSMQNLDLYYLDKSARISILHADKDIQIEDADDLFASTDGLAIGEIFRQVAESPLEIRDHEIAYFVVSFVLYAEDNSTGIRSSSDVALNYWEGQRLMKSFKVTSAPEARYRTAVMDKNGNIHVPKADKNDAGFSATEIGVGVAVAIIILASVIYVILKVRKSAHERGVRGFMNILLDLMRLNDDEL